jgi:hypothetical protein
MTIRRQIECDIPGCTAKFIETSPGEGWTGWGALQGISLNGKDNPCLCPDHLKAAAEFTSGLDKGTQWQPGPA